MSNNCDWNVAITRQDLEIERIHLNVSQTLYERFDCKVEIFVCVCVQNMSPKKVGRVNAIIW